MYGTRCFLPSGTALGNFCRYHSVVAAARPLRYDDMPAATRITFLHAESRAGVKGKECRAHTAVNSQLLGMTEQATFECAVDAQLLRAQAEADPRDDLKQQEQGRSRREGGRRPLLASLSCAHRDQVEQPPRGELIAALASRRVDRRRVTLSLRTAQPREQDVMV
eukprot:559703-Prymnesium_polylepis.2